MGLILVFDLDQTMIDSNGLSQRLQDKEHESISKHIDEFINLRIINTILNHVT